MSSEQLLRLYRQHISNLQHADDTGVDEELVLLTRDSVADVAEWTPEQQRLIDELDTRLVTKWRQLSAVLPNPNFVDDRRRWWWFLHEGPQVREEAKGLTQAA